MGTQGAWKLVHADMSIRAVRLEGSFCFSFQSNTSGTIKPIGKTSKTGEALVIPENKLRAFIEKNKKQFDTKIF